MGPLGPKGTAFKRHAVRSIMVICFAVCFALSYHAGRCSSLMSASKMPMRSPARAPPKCPTKSTLGDRVDIKTQFSNMNANHRNKRGRLSPRSSHVSRISAIQTPSNPKPLVEAPTAIFMGSATTDNKFPRKPAKMYMRQNFRRPNCFSMPRPIRSWKKTLKKMCIALACNVMGKRRRQKAPDAIEGPHEAPKRYKEQIFGAPATLPKRTEPRYSATCNTEIRQMNVLESKPGRRRLTRPSSSRSRFCCSLRSFGTGGGGIIMPSFKSPAAPAAPRPASA
mmetsp:Transcript_43391/g.114309  ORF Transcript_43391/g.114309 Transcript_43391/m.114309 type:complete len:280 (-) Transcript_43391:299-1138(-)